MDLAIRTAGLPADAPRWIDRYDSVWVEIDGDRLVLVEHAGQPVPVADAIPRATVTRQCGELTAAGSPTADQDETPDPAVTRVLHTLAAELHEHLCNCRAYPDSCTAKSRYDQNDMLATLTYAEPALEEALKQGWTPPAAAGEIPEAAVLAAARVQCGEWFDDLDGDDRAKTLADVRAALTAALPHLTGGRDAEIARLRARDAAWREYVDTLTDRLSSISMLVSKPASKCSDLFSWDVQSIDDLATTAGMPAVLRETAPVPEVDQPAVAQPQATD